ncbi:MAG: glycosyltransferase [Cetobacterium sp.]
MKKIILITEDICRIGGVEKVSVNLANELSKKNYKVIMIVLNSKREDNLKTNSKIQIIYLNIDLFKIFNIRTGNFFQAFIYFFKIIKIINSFSLQKNDCIIGMNLGVSRDFFLLFLKKIKKFKLIDTQHGELDYGNKLKNYVRSKIFNMLDYYIVLNKKMYEDAKNRLKLKNVKIIYNFIENKEIQYLNKRNGNRAISVGRLSHEKGTDLLIEIWKKVIEKNSKLKLDIVGDGPLMPSIIEKIEKYNLKNNINILGMSLNPEKHYSNADLFLLTSRTEGFGLVLLEAMKNKIPIISFDCPTGPQELIKNNHNGCLIKCFDLESYSKKILELFDNQIFRQEIIKNNQEKIKEFFPEKIILDWEEVIK